MTAPLSVRFDRDVLERLREHAAALPGATPSGLAQRLVDEGLRMADHPGIVFRNGPAGRRPALVVGPDLWELVVFLQEIDERGEAAVDAAAETFDLPASAVTAGIRYYTAFPAEIDAWISDSQAASERAEREWQRRQTLLS
ncbi:hypothetical protein Acsp06_64640 [Actinomycetospora sp. NBRC 106375]|uniref:hypothetical protein n=1 Tax=Actinomycetospora sp. NBRC 106375 TaxID=3032207 RepID=UPI0024A4123D|nr:hypothetical protein [Actinomycetospora sp. NBRC 106375]GLZ50279.1 hypothetical protein Acsp06_64640 [Actinomycetospora sp. NBRC 106375]